MDENRGFWSHSTKYDKTVRRTGITIRRTVLYIEVLMFCFKGTYMIVSTLCSDRIAAKFPFFDSLWVKK